LFFSHHLLPTLRENIAELLTVELPKVRLQLLQPLSQFVQNKVICNEAARIIFICTHNSRRSQFCQVWAQTAADFFGVPVQCFSGGVEVTKVSDQSVSSLERFGFDVVRGRGENPVHVIRHSEGGQGIRAFSKAYNDPVNSGEPFAVVMTCSDADDNCPVIPDAEIRFAMLYKDPMAFDDTPEEAVQYDECSAQIASEMLYVFSRITIQS